MPLLVNNHLLSKKCIFTLLFLCLFAQTHFSQISLTGTSAYTQNFDELSYISGSTTNNLTIAGWYMNEGGGGSRDNEQYAVDYGNSSTGDTYSYGTNGSSERALGCLQSGTLIPSFGACFTNNTGKPIIALDISYIGEEWRLGTSARTDQLNFEYSTDAASLTTGTWTNVAALNFITPDNTTTGAKDGNNPLDRTALSASISGLNIANGATFWIRWTDMNASGADDGLAVDDFSLTPVLPPYITFTSGSDYTPPVSVPGTNNNVVGRIKLLPEFGSVDLTSLTVEISGVHNGISNFNLWGSTDGIFEQAADQIIISAIDGAVVTFNGFSYTIYDGGAYLFLTANLDAGAAGEVTAIVKENSSFTFFGGILNTTINNDPFSQSAAPLPVELSDFNFKVIGNSVNLLWSTATELNNYGFDIERSLVIGHQSLVKWEKIGFVNGNGNSNSYKNYSFTDKDLIPGTYFYRLKQIDADGSYKYSPVKEVVIKSQSFSLGQNYPNPCNPEAIISFNIPEDNHVTLKLYDVAGREVLNLLDEDKTAGAYNVKINGAGLASGIYFYKLTAGSYTAVKKLSILK